MVVIPLAGFQMLAPFGSLPSLNKWENYNIKREYYLMTKYTKYRTFCLPKEIVDLLFLSAHILPIENNRESEIIIGLSVINHILSKSNQNRNKDRDRDN